jgi:deoxyribonuclease I
MKRTDLPSQQEGGAFMKRLIKLLTGQRLLRVCGAVLGIALLLAVLFVVLFEERSLKDIAGNLTRASSQQQGTAPPPSTFRPPAGFEITQIDADRAQWTWSKAKTHAADIWQAQLGSERSLTSFYCGCDITRRGKSGGDVSFENCGYRSRGNVTRAQRLEWEHIVPAAFIGKGRSCWEQGAAQCIDSAGKPFKGRSCCMIADPAFAMAANDPVNLVPAVGEVNGDRSNYDFGMLAGEPRVYGQCDVEIDSRSRTAEPPQHRRGDIARTYAYMSRAYGLRLSRAQAELYASWIAADPISAEEIRINQAIRSTGHRANPFVLSE